MSARPPLARLTRVTHLACPVVAYDWPFARMQAEAIAAHWRTRVARQPALFDGRVLLCRAPRCAEGVFHADFFETDFSAFLAWRDFGWPDARVFNGFAMAALRSADGAHLLGEMAPHTANAGQCYFPAGTPDRDDVHNGALDLAGSLARELREETGFDIETALVDPFWTVVAVSARIALMRGVRLPQTHDAAMAIARRHIAQDPHAELAGLRAVREMDDLAGATTPDFVRVYLQDMYAQERSARTRDRQSGGAQPG